MSELTDKYQDKEPRKKRRKLRAKPLQKRLGPRLGLTVYRHRDDFHYCPQTHEAGYWKKIRIQEIGGLKEWGPTCASLGFFAERILVGGVMVAGDYGFTPCEGSKRAVDEFVASRSNYLKFHPEIGQSLLVRVG